MNRVDMHRLQDLIRLHRLGTGPREVCRLLRMSPKTELRYHKLLAEAELLAGEPETLPELEVLKAAVLAKLPEAKPQHESTVERWADSVKSMLEDGTTPTSIYDRLRLRLESHYFDGSLSAIKRLFARLRKTEGIRAEDVAIPVQTEPGEVAQVNFGYVGKLFDPDQNRM